MNLNDLRRSALFAGLSDTELEQLVGQAQTVVVRAGEVLMEQGAPGDTAFIVLDGQFEVRKQIGQSTIKIDVRKPGEVLGEMALLNQAPRSATVRAQRDSHVLSIPQKAFDDLLSTNTTAIRAILHAVISRLTQNEALLHQQEKMAALGTLSAGLAHELNNPAAAAERSASALQQVISDWQGLTNELDAITINNDQAEWIRNLRGEILSRLGSPLKLDSLDRIDRAEELQAWLEEREVKQSWELAPAMVSYGWDPAALEKIRAEAARFPQKDASNLIFQWLGAGSQMMSLLAEVLEATGRIAQIVRAVKSYTYLDQAPLQEVDIHEGLENTLLILQHKTRQGIIIKRQYSSSLPRIEAYASELNQVWTNILDNAIDAMHGKGEISLHTYLQDDQVVIDISDNGPGIPPDIQQRIFEPFFTTKPPGLGTGLGLHISNDIVANRHHGQIKVFSKPGETLFRTILPRRIQGAQNG